MIKPQHRLIMVLSFSILSVLIGISALTAGDPLNFESFPHPDLVEIRLEKVTPERVTFKKFGFTFYLEGEMSVAGEIGSPKARLFRDVDGTLCISSLEPVQGIGSSLSDDGHACVVESNHLDKTYRLDDKWDDRNQGIEVGPIWASR